MDSCYDGDSAYDYLTMEEYDGVVLDIMLPGADGFDIMEYIRPLRIPVIFITARHEVKDRVKGLKEQIPAEPESHGHDDDCPQQNLVYKLHIRFPLLQQITEEAKVWQVTPKGNRYYIHTGIMVNALDRNLYLETLEDVTEVLNPWSAAPVHRC